MWAETGAALAAVELALGLVRGRVGADRIRWKGERDLVTETDVQVEDAIRAVLLERVPGVSVVGEERGGEPAPGDASYWLVDPICGTLNFASGLPLYAVNVALVEDGRVTVSVVGDGASGARYLAERGAGARMLTESGAVPMAVDDASGIVAFDTAKAPGGGFAGLVRAAILGDRWSVRILGTSLAFAHLAAGRLAGHVVLSLSSPVHTAAGCLLAEEAGALVTDFDGRPWSLASRSLLVAASAEVQRDLLRLVAAGTG